MTRSWWEGKGYGDLLWGGIDWWVKIVWSYRAAKFCSNLVHHLCFVHVRLMDWLRLHLLSSTIDRKLFCNNFTINRMLCIIFLHVTRYQTKWNTTPIGPLTLINHIYSSLRHYDPYRIYPLHLTINPFFSIKSPAAHFQNLEYPNEPSTTSLHICTNPARKTTELNNQVNTLNRQNPNDFQLNNSTIQSLPWIHVSDSCITPTSFLASRTWHHPAKPSSP